MVKNVPASAGGTRNSSLTPGSGRSLGGGNPLQYSFLGNPTDRGVWVDIVHGVAKESDMTEHTHTYRVQNIEKTWGH